MKSVGQVIKDIRKSKNMTQVEFSNEIGISRSYLGDIENDRKNLTIDTLCSILRSLNISLLDFVVEMHGGWYEQLRERELNRLFEEVLIEERSV